MAADQVDAAAAQQRLLNYLSVEGITGEEAAIAAMLVNDLEALGVPSTAISFDTANERIPLPTQTGNLLVKLPGNRPGPGLLFSTHMDTVPLCAGAKPIVDGNQIRTAGTTALGGDNRTGCAVLVTLVETLLKFDLPHPPLTLLFTVREETGLHGARELDPGALAGVSLGFNVDGRSVSDLVIGAVGQFNWEVEIRGRAAHAGVAPEKGISATLVGSLALAEAHRGGWFGKVVKPHGYGTSNVGTFGGKPGLAAGNATNVVTDYVFIRGEARSPDEAFAQEIVQAYKDAFATAKAMVTDSSGNTAEVTFTSKPSYPPFTLEETSAVVMHAQRAVEKIGRVPQTVRSNGGLDANWLVRHGVPTVTIGAGQNEIHTVNEFVDIPEFIAGCRLAVALATLE